MPAIFAQHGLRQRAAPTRVEGPALHVVEAEKHTITRRRRNPVKTPENLAVIRSMWGKPLVEIAAAIDCSMSHVSKLAKDLGLERRAGGGHRLTPYTNEQINATIRAAWTDPTLCALDIAKQCGWNHGQSVTKRAREIGLPRRHKALAQMVRK